MVFQIKSLSYANFPAAVHAAAMPLPGTIAILGRARTDVHVTGGIFVNFVLIDGDFVRFQLA